MKAATNIDTKPVEGAGAAPAGWLMQGVVGDDGLKWLESQDPDCSREEWLSTLLVAAKKGLTRAQAQAWSKGSSKFNQADFAAAWTNGLKKLNQPHDPDAPAPSTPEQLAASTTLEQHFKAWPDATADHPYLPKKDIPPDGLKVVPSSSTMTVAGLAVAGWLAVPCRTLEGVMTTLQYIGPDGQKLSAPGASFGSGMFIAGEVSLARPVYIGEGLASAWACVQATGGAAVCTFGSSRTGTVARALREAHGKNLRIIVVADRGKEAQAQKVAQEVDGYVVTMPDNKAPNYDANDYLSDHGSIALAELLLQSTKAVLMRYRMKSASDLMNAPSLKWMVKGLLPESGLCALYGPPGCGKSFLALDLCAAVAAGADWFGRRTIGTSVTYVCLEGQAGLGQRVRAWSADHKAKLPEHIGFIVQDFDLRNPDDVRDLAQAIHADGGDGGLIVLDTLNRAAPGSDENAAKDMGVLLGACTELQRLTGGVILLLHHTGKDVAKGLRGHSSLNGAVDVAIELSRTTDLREWAVTKSRDGQDGEHGAFRLRRVEMGVDADGDAVASCVVEPVDSPAPSPVKKLPASLQIAKPVYEQMNKDSAQVTFGELCKVVKAWYIGQGNPKGFRKDNLQRDYAKHFEVDKPDDDTLICL